MTKSDQTATCTKPMPLNESIVEDAALEWFGDLGYAVGSGLHLAPGKAVAVAESYSVSDVGLAGRLREAIQWLNPAISQEEPAIVAESAIARIKGILDQ